MRPRAPTSRFLIDPVTRLLLRADSLESCTGEVRRTPLSMHSGGWGQDGGVACRFVQDAGFWSRYREKVGLKADRKGGRDGLQARVGTDPRLRRGPGEG